MVWLAKKDTKEEKSVDGIKKPERASRVPEFVAPAAPEIVQPPVEQLIGPPMEIEPLSAAETTRPAAPAALPSLPPVIKDEVAQQIENILSEDLTDLFLKMDPEQQEEFRVKGEETASKIRLLLSSAKVGVKKILGLITEWLKLIPGVNKFFLEQEAKIKTDKILLNAEDFRKEGKL